MSVIGHAAADENGRIVDRLPGTCAEPDAPGMNMVDCNWRNERFKGNDIFFLRRLQRLGEVPIFTLSTLRIRGLVYSAAQGGALARHT